LDETESSFNTPKSTKQFGVLDLLLLTLSLGYLCGLIALGQTTNLGTYFVAWTRNLLGPLASFWMYGPMVAVVVSGVLGYVVNHSPRFAPRLFLKMYLVAMMGGIGIPAILRIIDRNPVPIGGMVAFGAFLFLPMWILHSFLFGKKITAAHGWVVLAAAFANLGSIVFLMSNTNPQS